MKTKDKYHRWNDFNAERAEMRRECLAVMKKKMVEELTTLVLESPQSFKRIIQECCKEMNVSYHDINSKRRLPDIVDTRILITWIIRNTFDKRFSYENIATFIGNKDHSTLLHYMKEFANRYETDAIYRKRVYRILDALGVDYDADERHIFINRTITS